MLVGAHNGGIDDDVREVGVIGERRAQTLPHAGFRPAVEPPPDRVPAAERRWQGAPVRASHSTASTNRRLSLPVAPRSPAVPGTKVSIRCHCASVNVLRLIPASCAKAALNHMRYQSGTFIVHRT